MNDIWKCPHCGGSLVWQNDYNRSDFYPDEDDDEGIATVYTCSECGAEVTCIDPSLEEKKDIMYWNLQNKNHEETNQ